MSSGDPPKLTVEFFRLASGVEPVRAWLRDELIREDRRVVGGDILAVQYRWPVGMPLVRAMGGGLFEVRCNLRTGIARVFFAVEGRTMVLLHGMVKKRQKAAPEDLFLARKRMKQFRGQLP